MTRDQFISWLKGFTAAVEETPTKGQWETIVSELNKIQECIDWSSPISDPNIFPKWQEPHYQYPRGPHYQYPSDINKVTCNTDDVIAISGSTSTQGIIIDGFVQNVSVTRANPPSTLTYTTGKPVKYKANLPKEKNDSKDS